MKKNQDLKYVNGFSLLEVIIAMLILSMVTAGSYGLFVTSHKFLNEAKHRLEALNQAGQVMERLRVYVSSHPDIPAGAGSALTTTGKHSPTIIGLSGHPEIEGAVADSTVWDYSVSGIEGADCKKVAVKVSWGEA